MIGLREVESPLIKEPRVIVSARLLIQSEINELLLLQRSEDDLHNKSLWELPGGKVEPGTTIAETQIQEALEETGLVVQLTDESAYMESSRIDSGRYEGSTFISIVGLAKVVRGSVVLSGEHQTYAWLRPGEFGTYDLTDVSKRALSYLNKF